MRLADHWALDPSIAFLNHGSFGACPRDVLDVQSALRAEMEAEPVRFLQDGLEARLDRALLALAALLGAAADDLAFVPNATTGVNAVLRSLRFAPGDELLTTDHAYNACRNALEWVAERAGARVVVAPVPFPLAAAQEAVDAILAAVTPRTRLALLDHVTSPTALVLPIERIVADLHRTGVDTLVDGAHAPGMVPVDLTAIGAAYYAGNCHKWLCAPKGAGFLHVRPDRQDGIVPATISHGLNSERTDRSRFRLLFDWTGTPDPTPYLTVPAAIDFMGSLFADGWAGVMAANRAMALEARDTLCEALETPPPAPDVMIGSMAAVPLAPATEGAPQDRLGMDPLKATLEREYGVQAPVLYWPYPNRIVRVSAQLYNRSRHYRRLADALVELGAAPRQWEPGTAAPTS